MSCNSCNGEKNRPQSSGVEFDAQALAAGDDVYSPWMSRRADNSIFILDVVYIDEIEKVSLAITVNIYHKESDDAGDGTVVSGGSITSQAAGRSWKEYSNLLGLVRYRISFSVDGADVGPAPAIVRLLNPVWFDSVLPG